jgi:hypothetical protein
MCVLREVDRAFDALNYEEVSLAHSQILLLKFANEL